MTVYKLNGFGDGGTDESVGQLDVIADGTITAVGGWMHSDADADDDLSRCEVSFASSQGFTANDTRSSFFGMVMQKALLTSGIFQNHVNAYVGGINLAVGIGERIHLHVSGTGAVVVTATIWIYVTDRVDSRLQRRR